MKEIIHRTRIALVFQSVIFILMLSVNFGNFEYDQGNFEDDQGNLISKNLNFETIATPSSAGFGLQGIYDTAGTVTNVKIVGNIAYVPSITGADNGIHILDISNKSNPVLLTRLNTGGYAWDIHVENNILYISENTYLRIYDVSNPAAPKSISNYTNIGQGFDLEIVGNFAYIASTWYGWYVINITNPYQPTLCSHKSGNYVFEMEIVGNYAFIVDNDTGLVCYDVSNPASPSLIGNETTFKDLQKIRIAGEYAYCISLSSGLQVYEISNPTQMTHINSYNGYFGGLDVRNHLAVVNDANTPYSLLCLNVDGMIPIQIVGTFSLTSYECEELILDENYVYACLGTRGLRIYQIAQTITPQKKGTRNIVDGTDYCREISVEGDNLNVAGRSYYYNILNVKDHSNPSVKYSSILPNYVKSISQVGSILYVGAAEKLFVMNVSSKNISPTEIGNYSFTGENIDLWIEGNRIYTAGGWQGVFVYDISNLTNPQKIGASGNTNLAAKLYIQNNLLYLADGQNGLCIYNISNIANFVQIGQYVTLGYANDIQVQGNLVYLTDSNFGLRILDVSNPFQPIQIGSFSTSNAENLYILGNLLYLDNANSVEIIDISNPRSPVKITQISSIDPRELCGDDRYLYVLNANTLEIYQIRKYAWEFLASPVMNVIDPSTDNDGMITLSWSYVATAQNYILYRYKELEGVNSARTVVTLTNNNYIDGKLEEGVYKYYVIAINSSLESNPSNTVSVIVDLPGDTDGNSNSNSNSNSVENPFNIPGYPIIWLMVYIGITMGITSVLIRKKLWKKMDLKELSHTH